MVFTVPAKWRVELRAKIGLYRNRCLTQVTPYSCCLNIYGYKYLDTNQQILG